VNAFKHCLSHLHDRFATTADNLGGKIDKSATKAGRVAALRYYILCHVFAEGFCDEVGKYHKVIVRRVHTEALEGQMLASHKLLYAAVVELLQSIGMGLVNYRRGLQKSPSSRIPKPLVKLPVAAEICVNERIGARSSEHRLLAFLTDRGEYGPAKAIVVTSLEAAAELIVRPCCLCPLHCGQGVVIYALQRFVEVVVKLSHTNVVYAQLFEPVEVLFAEKPAVTANHNRYIRAILRAHKTDQSGYRTHGTLLIIGVLLSRSKLNIDDVGSPMDMQRLESFFLLVCRLAALTLQRSIIIQHHRIYIQRDVPGLLSVQSPDKQLMYYRAPQRVSKPYEFTEESPNRTTADKILGIALKQRRLLGALTPCVETCQCGIGSVDESREYLPDNNPYGFAFAAKSKVPDGFLHQLQHTDFFDIAQDQRQPSPADHLLRSNLDTANLVLVVAMYYVLHMGNLLGWESACRWFVCFTYNLQHFSPKWVAFFV